ncbi:hypothetical protein GCM10011391_21600 [Pullulanibacillus camelliae]|uniref:Tetratricopeptide repeat protein n=1 Tax=Pullulanibacillus camelliae TaxID=1707096 RepID=A0A8J2VXK7_9BACL|nr:tetratricopeptide repeat protein [Pullulanibacillus camelliae]GGE42492.1 hypothetical protein GCM10011391_21600 [Pullulanibacillus camelliae]
MRLHKDGNIVHFPNLSVRLLDKGIAALKDKQYREAFDLFKQLHDIDPEHPQAAYGLAVCYVELGFYKEARDLTKEMMKRDIGHYYDVLKLHITVLIQMKEYQEVLTLIEAVLSENDVPTDIRQTLQQLEYFSQQRADEPVIEANIEGVQENFQHSQDDPSKIADSIAIGLQSTQYDHQLAAIQKARDFGVVSQALIEYLKSDADGFLKSLVLEALQENGYQESVNIIKFGNTYTVDLNEALFYNEFSDSVKQLLEDVLASNNPSLEDVAWQVWNHFVLTIFPRSLEPNEPKLWAAACYLYSNEMMGMEVEEEIIESLFSVAKDAIIPLVKDIREIEQNT